MQKKYKTQLIFSLMIVIVFFFALFLFSFLILQKRDKSPLKVSYQTSSVLRLKDLLPVSDTLGKTFIGKGTVDGVQGYVSFSIYNPTNRKISYDILLMEHDDSTSLNKIRANYVKLYLTNDIDVPFSGFDNRRLPTYSDLSVLKDEPGSKLLYRGILNGKEKENFRLRVWLSDSYSISNNQDEKNFIVDVKVRGN